MASTNCEVHAGRRGDRPGNGFCKGERRVCLAAPVVGGPVAAETTRAPLADRGAVVKIALLSPLWESVPPRCYGGTERVVWWLSEELVRRGHDVTLFASGDSVTSATLE